MENSRDSFGDIPICCAVGEDRTGVESLEQRLPSISTGNSDGDLGSRSPIDDVEPGCASELEFIHPFAAVSILELPIG